MKIRSRTSGRDALGPCRPLFGCQVALLGSWLVSVALGINLLHTSTSLAAERLINLGRTSLASVDASSVNGNRPLNCPYYGILNAFDNGRNMLNGFNYTTWLPQGQDAASAEVCFSQPVQVASILVEKGLPFKATISLSDGEERQIASEQVPRLTPTDPPDPPFIDSSLGKRNTPPSYRAELPSVLDNAVKVRLDFARPERERYSGDYTTGPCVTEIVIMGRVPPRVAYSVCQPKILMTDRNLLLVAQWAFQEWHQSLRTATRIVRSEDADSFVYTFIKGDLNLIKVTVSKKDGTASIVQLLNPATKRPAPQ